MEQTHRFSWNGELSVNTIILCLTVISTGWTLVKQVSESAAQTAVLKNEIVSLKAADAELKAQRAADRTEIVETLRRIDEKIDRLQDRVKR